MRGAYDGRGTVGLHVTGEYERGTHGKFEGHKGGHTRLERTYDGHTADRRQCSIQAWGGIRGELAVLGESTALDMVGGPSRDKRCTSSQHLHEEHNQMCVHGTTETLTHTR